MDKKMSFFRFCQRSLIALPVFLVFMACDKILPPSGNGVDIPVKIRAVSIAGGAENETVTRAGGDSRMVGEPIIQDLGNGMLAEISVEEDFSALRDEQRLDDGAKLRIIALNKGTSTIYSWADYTATSSGEFSRVNGNLHVVENTDYDFVCFSYNSTTASLPAALSEGGTLGSIAVTNANDFLYKKWTTNLSTTSNTLSFTLEQQFAKVTLILNGGSRTITSVDESTNSIKILSVSTPATFNLATKALSGSTPGDQPFTGWETPGTTLEKLLRLVPKSGTSTLELPAQAITVGNLKSEAKSISLPALGVGKSYTVRIRLVLKFAGSNIYWDSANSRLTFDAYNFNNSSRRQGVFFKWGSLIGVSPHGLAYSSSGIVLFVPDNIDNRTWKQPTTGSVCGWSDWDAIPYSAAMSPSGDDAKTLLNNPDFGSYKGDICNYINSAYRMPTLTELKDLYLSNVYSYSWPDLGGSSFSDCFADGTQVFDQYGIFTGISGISYEFPASGFRNFMGNLSNVAEYGYAMSGSAYDGKRMYKTFLYFSPAGSPGTDFTDRNSAQTVRCVLQE
jgi:hypothetical protein